MDAKELLALISSPADAAIVSFGFIVGAPVDRYLLHMSVPLGTVSAYTVAAAFCLKKVFDLAQERKKKAANERHPKLTKVASEVLSELQKRIADVDNGRISDPDFREKVRAVAFELDKLRELHAGIGDNLD